MKKEEKNQKRSLNKTGADMKTDSAINTDPFGSYTGVDTENEYDVPVQDVDDL